jgi:hypothetical protein
MTREIINIGTTANDGTGDTLRGFAIKSNNNFSDVYKIIGGDSSDFVGNVKLGNNQVVFHGASLLDNFKTTITSSISSKSNTITFPDSSGGVVITTADQNLFRKHLFNTKIDGDLRLHGVSGTGYYYVRYQGVVDSGDDLIINLPDLLDSDTWVFAKHTATLTNKTLTTPVLTTPKVITSIDDTNGAELIKVTATASAVNEITVTNAATANKPSITATGGDTNITLRLAGKGTGSVEIGKASYTSSTITADGAASTTATYIICNKSTALAVSLANGTVIGETKIFTNSGAGVATITPATFAQGTSFALAQYDGCQVIWDGSRWYLIGNQGEVTIA